jgi:hypothetical protein
MFILFKLKSCLQFGVFQWTGLILTMLKTDSICSFANVGNIITTFKKSLNATDGDFEVKRAKVKD